MIDGYAAQASVKRDLSFLLSSWEQQRRGPFSFELGETIRLADNYYIGKDGSYVPLYLVPFTFIYGKERSENHCAHVNPLDGEVIHIE